MKWRKKPVTIDAIQWNDQPKKDWPDWLLEAMERKEVARVNGKLRGGAPSNLSITTLEGRMEARPGDYVIRGVKNELYPCKPDIFAATYEPAADEGEG